MGDFTQGQIVTIVVQPPGWIMRNAESTKPVVIGARLDLENRARPGSRSIINYRVDAHMVDHWGQPVRSFGPLAFEQFGLDCQLCAIINRKDLIPTVTEPIGSSYKIGIYVTRISGAVRRTIEVIWTREFIITGAAGANDGTSDHKTHYHVIRTNKPLASEFEQNFLAALDEDGIEY